VAAAVDGWRAHLLAAGCSPRDIELLAEQIDRPFLLDQRAAVR
jgi:serine/threonine-protein kinase HipA